MQPASPRELVDSLRRELEERARREVADHNARRAAAGAGPEVEHVIHPGERIRLISRRRPSTLLIDVAEDELAINIVLATGQEALPGYPKQVPLRIVLENDVPVLQTNTNGGSPRDVLADAFAEYFRHIAS